jgi:RNA polymerase sigma-19 factor, ECF subfamily
MATELLTNEALSQLYREHHSWLLGWLDKRVQCRLQAEDHAHDTFVRVMASGRTPDLNEPRPYLATIAKNLLINHSIFQSRHEPERRRFMSNGLGGALLGFVD